MANCIHGISLDVPCSRCEAYVSPASPSVPEDQTTICVWADLTFGPSTVEASLRRCLVEVREFAAAPLGALPAEAADVLITLYRVAHCAGFDLQAEVDRKMSINRARKWRSNGDGTGQHIKEPS